MPSTAADDGVVNDIAVVIHKKYIINYVINVEPGCEKGTSFPGYGNDRNALDEQLRKLKL